MDAQDQNPRSIFGKNMSSDQVPQEKAEKSSSSEGAAAAAKNVVVLKTDPGG